MVFESIVTDLMNRFLGDFIENLDKKQLNIGIWGGMYLILFFMTRVTSIRVRKLFIDFSSISAM